MSLNWNWKDKCGEATFFENYPDSEPRTYTVNLYEGNAYLIFIYEYEENGEGMYTLNSFWCDKTHMNRCLGIDKKYKATYGENMYEKPYSRLTKIRLNKAKCRNIKEIIKAMVEAFDNLEIEIYNEGDE